jgi:hypothetical protein
MTDLDHHAARLASIRITVFGLWIATALQTSVAYFADLPREIFSPIGFLAWLPSGFWDLMLQPGPLAGLKAAILIGCGLCIAGIRPFALVALPLALLLLLFDGIAKSFSGFTNHAQVGILYAAIILALSPSADRLSLAGKKKRLEAAGGYEVAVLGIAALVYSSYMFIALRRLTTGGLEIFTGDAILTYIAARSHQYSEYGFELGLAVLQYPVLATAAKVGFVGITILEVLAPVCIISRRFAILWVAALIPFHLSTFLLMNILFLENAVLLVALTLAIHGRIDDRKMSRHRSYVGGSAVREQEVASV